MAALGTIAFQFAPREKRTKKKEDKIGKYKEKQVLPILAAWSEFQFKHRKSNRTSKTITVLYDLHKSLMTGKPDF